MLQKCKVFFLKDFYVFVKVPIIENSVCQEMFAAAGHTKKILQSFLCAGYANGQKDSKLNDLFLI